MHSSKSLRASPTEICAAVPECDARIRTSPILHRCFQGETFMSHQLRCCILRGLQGRRRGRLSTALKTTSAAGGHGDSDTALSPPPLGDWLRSFGGTVNDVELRTVLFPSGAADRKLVATADHPPGTLLISVPRQLQLRYDNIEVAAAAAIASPAGTLNLPIHNKDQGQDGHQPKGAIGAQSSDTASQGSGLSKDGPLVIPPHDATALVALFDKMPRGSDTGGAAWQFKQALTILYHLSRGSASPLMPYLSYLPGLAPGVPTPRVAMLMYDDAVEELQYGTIVQDIRNQKYWLRHVAREVLGGLDDTSGEGAGTGGGASSSGDESVSPFGGLQVDEEMFGWAAAVAMSRCFGLSRFRTHTCVPLVDMANHVAPHDASNCEIRSGPDGEVNMFAKKQVKAGEELMLTYGSHDNHNLLLSYGFTMQPNPNDAFYFDLDMDTLENLVEGMGNEGGLAAWQRSLLSSKLGLGLAGSVGPGHGAAAAVRPSDDVSRGSAAGGEASARSDDGGDGSGSTTSISTGSSPEGKALEPGPIKVYLAAVAPSASAVAAASGAGTGSVEAEPIAGEQGNEGASPAVPGGSATTVVRQSVDPRLLAALRIATLQDEAWTRVLGPLSADQIGDWRGLLARQQEISLMRLLASLVTAIYTTFPTTIQQDRQLLATASIDVAAAAAAATLTTVSPAASPSQNHLPGAWPLRPHGSAGDPGAAAVATHARDMAEAIRFRLGLKTTLEGCLKALVARAKELDALQQVR